MLLTNALALLVLTASWDSLSELHHHIPEQQSFQRGLLGCLWTEGSSTIRCHVGGVGWMFACSQAAVRTLNRSIHSKLPKVVTSKGGSAYYLEL